jgi:hypothetical protein
LLKGKLNLSLINTAMDSSTQTSAADANDTCVCRELFNLVEKLRIELHKNEEELRKKDE